METLISNAQTELNSRLESFKSRLSSLEQTDASEANCNSYMSIIFPVAMKLYEKLTTYPRITTLSQPIDVYSECIALRLIHEYEHKLEDHVIDPKLLKTEIPNHALVTTLIQHPFLISIVQMGYSTTEWIEKRNELLNECKNLFGESVSPDVTAFMNLVSTPISSDGITSLQLFHFLIGFTYAAEFTGIEASNVPGFRDAEYSYISINASYNLANVDSIIIYHNIPKFKQKLLNISTIHEFNAFQKPEHVFKAERPYVLLNHEFKSIDASKLTNKVVVLICYNDDISPLKSHYTVAFPHVSKNMNNLGGSLGVSKDSVKTVSLIGSQDSEPINSRKKIEKHSHRQKRNQSSNDKSENSNAKQTDIMQNGPLRLCRSANDWVKNTPYVCKQEALNLMNGIVSYTIDDVDLKLYLETNFYNLISDSEEQYQDLKDVYSQFMAIIRDEYNRSGKDMIADNIVKNPKITEIFDKTELPFLRAYLLHLSSLLVYDLPSVMNYAIAYLYEGFIANEDI